MERALAGAGAFDLNQQQRELAARAILGSAAHALFDKVATTQGIEIVMRGFVDHFELEARQCLQALMAMDDPTTADAKSMHFRARVAGAVIGTIKEFIESGAAAIRETEESNSEE